MQAGELVKALEYSVVLAAHRAEWQAARVVLPVTAWSEEEGTYTNFEGRVQFAGKAIEPVGDALPVWEVFAMLLHDERRESLWMSPEDVFVTMTEQVPAYRDISLEQTRLPGRSSRLNELHMKKAAKVINVRRPRCSAIVVCERDSRSARRNGVDPEPDGRQPDRQGECNHSLSGRAPRLLGSLPGAHIF